MAACQTSVNVDFRIEINRTEIQQNLLSLPLLRNINQAVIPDACYEVFMLHAREFTLRSKGNHDFAFE